MLRHYLLSDLHPAAFKPMKLESPKPYEPPPSDIPEPEPNNTPEPEPIKTPEPWSD
ncbi:Uncharacterised protein [Legionella beliardensis]|uniref:Uncharacterized protein n=1 Tax=Legionella beliardensis TaxID=91822 RepID=A0A378HZJ7_9GAMM|nr:hypothetical protein [Legionella beliardensis]STX28347.1 Uncharacterised protein [Legionella beliardensis]